MTRIKQHNIYNEIKTHRVYVIIHPSTLQFFIGTSTAKNLQPTFSTHYTLKNEHTRNLFTEHRHTDEVPDMYVVEVVDTTASEIVQHKYAWIKYFSDMTFSCLNSEDDINASSNMYPETQFIYDKIKATRLSEIINGETRIVANYGNRRKEVSDSKYAAEKKQVKFFCDPDEYEIIQAHAKSSGKSVSAYLRDVAVQGCVFNIDYNAIRNHTNELSLIKNKQNAIIKYLLSNYEVMPQDIETMISLLEEIRDSENKLLRSHTNECSNRYAKIKRYLKEIF